MKVRTAAALLLLVGLIGLRIAFPYFVHGKPEKAVPGGIAAYFANVTSGPKAEVREVDLPFAPATLFTQLENGPFLRLGLDPSLTPVQLSLVVQTVQKPGVSLHVDPVTQPALSACPKAKAILTANPNLRFLVPPNKLFFLCRPTETCRKFDGDLHFELSPQVAADALKLGEVLDLIWTAKTCSAPVMIAPGQVKLAKAYLSAE